MDDRLNDPFGRARLPDTFDRESRVRLLSEAFEALLRGEMPTDAARLFLAAGGAAWLQNGGDLEGDFWKIKAPAGSHHTPARLWQTSSRGATPDERTSIMADRSDEATP